MNWITWYDLWSWMIDNIGFISAGGLRACELWGSCGRELWKARTLPLLWAGRGYLGDTPWTSYQSLGWIQPVGIKHIQSMKHVRSTTGSTSHWFTLATAHGRRKPAQALTIQSLAAMPPKAAIVEEEWVGVELQIFKPMRFKVSVTLLHVDTYFTWHRSNLIR